MGACRRDSRSRHDVPWYTNCILYRYRLPCRPRFSPCMMHGARPLSHCEGDPSYAAACMPGIGAAAFSTPLANSSMHPFTLSASCVGEGSAVPFTHAPIHDPPPCPRRTSCVGLAQQHRPCAPMHPLSQVQDQLQQQLAGVGQAQQAAAEFTAESEQRAREREQRTAELEASQRQRSRAVRLVFTRVGD